jgi:hypothetical protein
MAANGSFMHNAVACCGGETGAASPSHLGLVWNLLQEDTILIDLVQKYGEKRWNMVANGLPGRTGKGCSHRCVLLLSWSSGAVHCSQANQLTSSWESNSQRS